MTNPIPPGYRAVTPSLTFKDSKKAIAYYERAFGAKALDVFPALKGDGVMHATIRIGDCILMMGDEMPHPDSPKSAESAGGSPMSLYLYVDDADSAFERAVAAGGKPLMPVADMFWGDRAGTIQDPFGYQWMIATHKRDLNQEQVRAEAEAFFAQFDANKS